MRLGPAAAAVDHAVAGAILTVEFDLLAVKVQVAVAGALVIAIGNDDLVAGHGSLEGLGDAGIIRGTVIVDPQNFRVSGHDETQDEQ